MRLVRRWAPEFGYWQIEGWKRIMVPIDGDLPAMERGAMMRFWLRLGGPKPLDAYYISGVELEARPGVAYVNGEGPFGMAAVKVEPS